MIREAATRLHMTARWSSSEVGVVAEIWPLATIQRLGLRTHIGGMPLLAKITAWTVDYLACKRITFQEAGARLMRKVSSSMLMPSRRLGLMRPGCSLLLAASRWSSRSSSAFSISRSAKPPGADGKIDLFLEMAVQHEQIEPLAIRVGHR